MWLKRNSAIAEKATDRPGERAQSKFGSSMSLAALQRGPHPVRLELARSEVPHFLATRDTKTKFVHNAIRAATFSTDRTLPLERRPFLRAKLEPF
jgi:hypothetical protein